MNISSCKATYRTYSDVFDKSKVVKQKGTTIMNINPLNFISNLKYMLGGMIGIFIVIGIIVLITMLLNKTFSK